MKKLKKPKQKKRKNKNNSKKIKIINRRTTGSQTLKEAMAEAPIEMDYTPTQDYKKLTYSQLQEAFQSELAYMSTDPSKLSAEQYFGTELYRIKREIADRDLRERVTNDFNNDLEKIVNDEIKLETEVKITKEALDKSKTIAKEMVELGHKSELGTNEIYLTGIAPRKRVELGDLTTTDIHINPDQICSNTNCKTTSEGQLKTRDDLRDKEMQISSWIHSHPDKVFFSDIDEDNIKNLARFAGMKKNFKYKNAGIQSSLNFSYHPGIVVCGIDDTATAGVMLARKMKTYDKDTDKVSTVGDYKYKFLKQYRGEVKLNIIQEKNGIDQTIRRIRKELIEKVKIRRFNKLYPLSEYFNSREELRKKAELEDKREASEIIREKLMQPHTKVNLYQQKIKKDETLREHLRSKEVVPVIPDEKPVISSIRTLINGGSFTINGQEYFLRSTKGDRKEEELFARFYEKHPLSLTPVSEKNNYKAA